MGLSELDNNYSDQLHGFVRSCLMESEDERPSMEDHLNWFKPYAVDAKNKRLTFKGKKIQKELVGGDNFFDIAQIEETVNINEEVEVEAPQRPFNDVYNNQSAMGGQTDD